MDRNNDWFLIPLAIRPSSAGRAAIWLWAQARIVPWTFYYRKLYNLKFLSSSKLIKIFQQLDPKNFDLMFEVLENCADSGTFPIRYLKKIMP